MPSQVIQVRSSLGVAEIAHIFRDTLHGRRADFGKIDDDDNPFETVDKQPDFSAMASCKKNMGSWAVQIYIYNEGDSRLVELHALYYSAFSRAMAPEVLAVQEVGEAEALADLVERLAGSWHTALADPDGRGICVGILSRFPLGNVEQVTNFPEGLRPIQVDDTATTMSKMGRPALHVRVEADGHTLDVISCHLKSKLLTFPGGPLQSQRRGRTSPLRGLRPEPQGQLKPPPSGPTPPISWSAMARAVRWLWLVISTMSPKPRPPSFCTAHQAQRSAPRGSITRTRAMGNGSGTWRRSSPKISAFPVSTEAEAS